jgi:hypothetical protein
MNFINKSIKIEVTIRAVSVHQMFGDFCIYIFYETTAKKLLVT